MKKPEKYLGKIFLPLLKLSIPPEKYPAENFDPSQVRNILIVLRHQMGDALCALPMLKAVRETFHEAHITLVTKASTNYLELFKDNDTYSDEVKEFEYGFENFVNLIKELRERTYDLAVIPSTVDFSVTNHLIAYYSRAKYRVGVASFNGSDNPCGFTLNVKNDFQWERAKVHQVRRNLDVIAQLNINSADSKIRIPLSPQYLDYARSFHDKYFPDSSRPVIGFHPGAAKANNVWEPVNFAKLAGGLMELFDPYIFISQGPKDNVYVEKLISLLKEKYPGERIVVHKGALMNNLALISLLDLFVANDTGIMHLAAGTDVPMVSLFGPTRAYEWAPVGKNKVSIQSSTRNINDILPEKVLDLCVGILKHEESLKAQ